MLLVLGALALLAAYRLAGSARPTGHVDHVDTEVEAYIPHGPLVNIRQGLGGYVDGMISLLEENHVAPVRVFEGQMAPSTASESDRMQAALMCRLVETVYGHTVSYGVLRYEDRDLVVNWTPGLSSELDALLTDMQGLVVADDTSRSHNERAVCLDCPVSAYCDQSLE